MNEAKFEVADRDGFVNVFQNVYEHSSWVAEKAFDALNSNAAFGFQDIADLMASLVNGSGREVQLGLLCAHPDLAGRLALRGELTDASRKEQHSAGLDQCTVEELEKFQRLNRAYKSKFGFPYIIAVSGLNREEILANFEGRIENATEEEFKTALREVHKIARIRLAAIFKERKE